MRWNRTTSWNARMHTARLFEWGRRNITYIVFGYEICLSRAVTLWIEYMNGIYACKWSCYGLRWFAESVVSKYVYIYICFTWIFCDNGRNLQRTFYHIFSARWQMWHMSGIYAKCVCTRIHTLKFTGVRRILTEFRHKVFAVLEYVYFVILNTNL